MAVPKSAALPDEIWSQIVLEVGNLEVKIHGDLPFEGFRLKHKREEHLPVDNASLKSLRLVNKTLAALAGPKLFQKVHMNPFEAPLTHGASEFQAFRLSANAKYVEKISLDQRRSETEEEQRSEQRRAIALPQVTQAYATLEELQDFLPTAGGRFTNVSTVRDRSEQYLWDDGRTEEQLKTGSDALSGCVIQLVHGLPDGNITSLQITMPALATIAAQPWAPAKLVSVQRLHLQAIDQSALEQSAAGNASASINTIVSLLPHLRAVILHDFDLTDQRFVKDMANLAEIHLNSGEATIAQLRKVLQRNAPTLQKVSIYWTYFPWRDKAVQRAFRGLDLPNLESIDLEIQLHNQDDWSDRIPMANWSWSRASDNVARLSNWLASNGWGRWDDQWSDS